MFPARNRSFLLAALLIPFLATAEQREVKITPDIGAVEVTHGGETVVIERDQDSSGTIDPSYARTSRPCPPFCVQPMSLHPAVQTIGEIELLDYLRRASQGDESIVVIDSRTPDWVERGTIPGAINIPWTQLDLSRARAGDVAAILQFDFGVTQLKEFWNFDNAKTLILFCNGFWCGQSPTNIRNLLSIGYPPEKLKWYRGGMQAWKLLGLTTVEPE
jgi:rhodanese-related sulfurtransferase